MRRREFLAVAAAPALAAGSPQFIKSICSVIFPPNTPLPECFKRAKAAGFDAIEIRMSEEVSLDSTPDQMKQLADDAHKAGVMIASMWVSRPLSQHPINSPDPAVRAQVLHDLCGFVTSLGAAILGVCDSSHPGPAGNREYLLYLASPGHPVSQEREVDVDAEIRDAVHNPG